MKINKTIIALSIISIFLLTAGCIKLEKQEVKTMDLSTKKIVMIVAPENFRDEEFFHPKEVFEQYNAVVTIASKGVKEATGKLGGTTPVHMDISEINGAQYDAVIFVGGPGAEIYFGDPQAHKVARDANTAGKIVAAICVAPTILANAGILAGKSATAFESEAATIKSKAKEYTGEPVTVDGNLVTGNGPEAAREFGIEISKLLMVQ